MKWLISKNRWYMVIIGIEFFIILCILSFFVVIPICHTGWVKYVGYEREGNPIVAKLSKKYLQYQKEQLSANWLSKVERIEEDILPIYEWVEDTLTSKGMESFYCLDQMSDDVRDFLKPEWNLTHNQMNMWNSHFSNKYIFAPENNSMVSPVYNISSSDTSVLIEAGPKIDTWIYLPAKQKQSVIYALDFDYMPHIDMQETLQICFAVNSLASRFRFLLEKNQTLRFDIVDYGFFLASANSKEWNSRFKIPSTIPLNQYTHIRLLVMENIYALYYDNKFQMAIRVNDYVPQENYWSLIFWNGIEKESPLSMELKNFKICHPKK